MLFNSYEFLFLFLPLTLAVFFFLGKHGRDRLAVAWLILMSFVYYGWWAPQYMILIAASICFNFAIGKLLASPSFSPGGRKGLLTLGLTVNLGLLGYYKYANFFLSAVEAATGSEIGALAVILPIGISFFTFQKVAYLVDAYRRETQEYNFLNFALFVIFFPQLIAGPIVHHKDVMGQFKDPETYRPKAMNMAVGATILAIGLVKKVLFADTISTFASPVFNAADQGQVLTMAEAWTGALAYTLQLYFDFSAYSDMAIGVARMFGVLLPLNFNSPYKSLGIADFWRRWHMTLSRFLRDYLYISLGGNRKGELRTRINLMATMLLGGLWHGAGWTYVFWGGLHGAYLVINREWTDRVSRAGKLGNAPKTWWYRGIMRGVTLLAAVVAWVFFRATTMDGAWRVLSGMAGANAWAMGVPSPEVATVPIEIGQGLLFIILLGALALFAPNTQEWLARFRPALDAPPPETVPHLWPNVPGFVRRLANLLTWRPSGAWGATMAALIVIAILSLVKESEFIYFQF